MRLVLTFVLGLLLATSCCLPLAPPDPPPPVPEPVAVEPMAPPIAPAPTPAVAVPAQSGRLTAGSFEALTLDVPQAPSPTSLFENAAPHVSGPLGRSLLVCRVNLLGGGFDDSVLAGGADVALAVKLRNGTARSTGQSPERVYTFPVSHLALHDAIWIRVIDVDVVFNDTIAEGSTSFAHTPFSLGMGQANVECRAVEGAAVEQPSRSTLAALSRSVDELSRSESNLAEEELGYPHERAQAVLAQARSALAWHEPSDSAYRTQVERAIAFDAQWNRRAAAAVRAATSELPAPGASAPLGTGRQIRVARVACGTEANALADQIGEAMRGNTGACLATLEIQASRPISLPSLDDASAQLEASSIELDARIDRAWLVARRREGAWVAPSETISLQRGERVEMVFAMRSSEAPLLRARDGGGQPVVLRVR